MTSFLQLTVIPLEMTLNEALTVHEFWDYTSAFIFQYQSDGHPPQSKPTPLWDSFSQFNAVITTYVQFASKALDQRLQVDTDTDFIKAFDRVNHFILQHKLKLFCFLDSLVNMVNSIIANRQQFAKYRGFIS